MADVGLSLVEIIWRVLILLLAGYVTYRFEMRMRREEQHEQRLSTALDKAEKNNRALQGEDSAIGQGLVEVVEIHDEELDDHDQRLREAKEERQDIKQRLAAVKRHSEERNADP